MIERLKDLFPLLPGMEYRAVRHAIREAILHIRKLEARIAEQDKHLAMLRAQLLKR